LWLSCSRYLLGQVRRQLTLQLQLHGFLHDLCISPVCLLTCSTQPAAAAACAACCSHVASLVFWLACDGLAAAADVELVQGLLVLVLTAARLAGLLLSWLWA
jgi:hypothetical protein